VGKGDCGVRVVAEGEGGAAGGEGGRKGERRGQG
jgi:hypothetical protein